MLALTQGQKKILEVQAFKKPNVHPIYQDKRGSRGENQDGGIGRHTAPPRTTRTDRKSNGKEVQHQGNKK